MLLENRVQLRHSPSCPPNFQVCFTGARYDLNSFVFTTHVKLVEISSHVGR